MVDFAELLSGCISSGTGVLKRLEVNPSDARACDDGRVKFLESQLAHIVSELTGMLVDLMSGMSISDLDFASDDEFMEMIAMCTLQIQNLKAQIRSFREVGR